MGVGGERLPVEGLGGLAVARTMAGGGFGHGVAHEKGMKQERGECKAALAAGMSYGFAAPMPWSS